MLSFASFADWSTATAVPTRLAEPFDGGRFGWSGERDARFYVRRSALLLAIVAAHLLILWLALLLTGFTGRLPPRAKTLAVFDVSDVETPDAPAKPAEHVQVSKIRPQLLVPTTITIDAPPASAGSGTGQGCGMAGVLAKGISENPEAMAAVAALPRDVRSDADAVMLWNGTWLNTGHSAALAGVPLVSAMTGQDPVAVLKTVILATLAAAPAECREVESLGPQLIAVAEPGRTTMLVIGSGAWRWASLVEPAVDPLATPGADQTGADGRFAAAPTGN
jgi:hypothetical protein